jgi:beta-lactamase regulating signal transducer with metallopeptidase domain
MNMDELAFPLAGAVALFAVAIPIAAIAAKAMLLALERAEGDALAAGGASRYLLCVLPVLAPAAWLGSAALHHAEEGEAALSCLLDHVSEGHCAEPLILLGMLSCLIVVVVARVHHVATRSIARLPALEDGRLARRVARIVAAHPVLTTHRDRFGLVESGELRTVGLFSPRIEIGAAAAHLLDDAALAAALHHEIAHVRGRDPLRIVIAGVCQAVNPLAFLLAPELGRWGAAREIACDRAAVEDGADPLALAAALVALSRPRAASADAVAHLGHGGGIELLRLRVALLLEGAPAPARQPHGVGLVAAMLFFAVVSLPHHLDAWPLAELHPRAERLFLEPR